MNSFTSHKQSVAFTQGAVHRSGTSLVEVMVAIVITTIGFLALAGSAAHATVWHELVTNRNEMVQMADSRLEELRSAAVLRTADTVKLAVGGSVSSSTANHSDTLTSPRGLVVIRRWSVTAGPAGVRAIHLRVTPLVDSKRAPAQIDFNTMVHIL